MDTFGVEGIITLYEIPEEWAQDDELFRAMWLPKTELGNDGLYHIIEQSRISDEAKAGRMTKAPVHNLFTTLGYTLLLANLSVANQSQMFPITQILSIGNTLTAGVTRGDPGVSNDGFASGSRKAPVSYSVVGFLTTISINFAAGDALGNWTDLGFYSYNIALSQNASTTPGTGALATHARYPFNKTNVAYSVQYAFLLNN